MLAWDGLGQKVYEYQAGDKVNSIVDCYALNAVSGNEVWCYYYTGFPLVKIVNKTIENYWHMPVHGSSCFAIYQDYALLYGGYHDGGNDLILVQLEKDHQATVKKRFTLQGIVNCERTTARGHFCMCWRKEMYIVFLCRNWCEKY